MYHDEWGNTYKTLNDARTGVGKHFDIDVIASELYYHIDIDKLLEWCVDNADFHKRFSQEFENTINALCEEYIFEEEE